MKNQQDFLLSAIIGAVIGASVTLLTTPISGKEIRKKVQKGLNLLNGTNQKTMRKSFSVNGRRHAAKRVHVKPRKAKAK